MAKEYIDREEAIKAIENLCIEENENWIGNDNCSFIDRDEAIDSIADIPADNVVPVVHGKWIWKRRNRGGFNKHTGKDDAGEIHTITVDERIEVFEPYCSVCGKWNDGMHYFYCPNCGAKMDGEDRGGTKC